VVTDRCAGDVTPFDQDDPVELRELVQGEVLDVAGSLEPVEVGVVEGEPPTRHRVAVDQGEGRGGDRFGDAERSTEALGERRLAGSHVAGEHDDVTRARERRQHRRDGVGVSE